jgi:hypothetical protein
MPCHTVLTSIQPHAKGNEACGWPNQVDFKKQQQGRHKSCLRSCLHSLPLNLVLSTLLPSSSCSSTVKSGNFFGNILLGLLPGTILYFPKSVTPQCSRRKSSSRTQRPLTVVAGA